MFMNGRTISHMTIVHEFTKIYAHEYCWNHSIVSWLYATVIFSIVWRSENWFILSRCLLLRNNASKSLRTWKKNKSIAHDTVKFDIAQCTIMLYALNIHVLLHVIGMNKKDEQTKLWNPWQSIPRGSDVWLVFINIIGP